MAYYDDPYKMVVRLRAVYAALNPNDEAISRIIKPITLPGSNITPENSASSSPPIKFNMAAISREFPSNQLASRTRRHLKMRRKPTTDTSSTPLTVLKSKRHGLELIEEEGAASGDNISIDSDFGVPVNLQGQVVKKFNPESTITSKIESDQQLNESQPLGTSFVSGSVPKQYQDRQTRREIAEAIRKAFSSSVQDSGPLKEHQRIIQPDFESANGHIISDDNTISHIHDGHMSHDESEEDDDFYYNFEDEDQDADQENSTGLRKSSDFKTPKNSNKDHIPKKTLQTTLNGDRSEEIETEETETDEQTDLDEEEDYDDVSSTDSAFTDIEADSMLDDSLMMLESYSFHRSMDDFQSVKLKKKKSSSFGAALVQRPQLKVPGTANGQITHSDARKGLLFEKIKPQGPPKVSGLLLLIESKFKSVNKNPLSYYSFVNQDSTDLPVRKLRINIFLSNCTDPRLRNVQINANSTVVDTIGYLLWKLAEEKEPISSLNPNHFRLVMVDEDGESYGSFGTLGRDRLLLSYNDLTDLSLESVTDLEEQKRNETQTPLPAEYKERILNTTNSKMTVTIVRQDGLKEDFSFERGETVGDLLDSYCKFVNFTKDKYRFKDEEGNFIDLKDLVMRIPVNKRVFYITPTLRSLLDVAAAPKSVKDTTDFKETSEITPSSATTYKLNDLTPNIRQQTLAHESGISLPKNSISNIKPRRKSNSKKSTMEEFQKSIQANRYLESIMSGKTLGSTAPTNLNNIYFKWQVFRKKATILNKIEKLLIIDGDYIHLTPPDDAAFKNALGLLPVIQASNNHAHHYNYLKYYKQLLMKTTLFHVSQIVRIKQYKNSKNPLHFKIITKKVGTNDKELNKRYDLEAVNNKQCDEIVQKLKWVMEVYKNNQ